MRCIEHKIRDCDDCRTFELEESDYIEARERFEKRAGMTLEEAATYVNWCGCCYEPPDHLNDAWFDQQMRRLKWMFPEVERIARETAERKYEERMS